MQADLQTQRAFELLYNNNQLMVRLRREFDIPEVIAQCEANLIPTEFGINLLIQMVLHKRAAPAVLIGILWKHFKKETNPMQACSDMLIEAARADFMDWSEVGQTFILRIDVTPDVYEDLNRYQYPLPMLLEPMTVEDNSQCGYYTHESSIIL